MIKALHSVVITPVIGFSESSFVTQSLHFLHSLGSVPASRHFTGAHQCQLNHNTVSHPNQVPWFNTWVESQQCGLKCLAEGQKYRAIVGFEPGLSALMSRAVTPAIPRAPPQPGVAESAQRIITTVETAHYTIPHDAHAYLIFIVHALVRNCAKT